MKKHSTRCSTNSAQNTGCKLCVNEHGFSEGFLCFNGSHDVVKIHRCRHMSN